MWSTRQRAAIEYIGRPWIPEGDAFAAGYTKPGWYYWDKTWTDCFGPYKTEALAVEAMDKEHQQE